MTYRWDKDRERTLESLFGPGLMDLLRQAFNEGAKQERRYALAWLRSEYGISVEPLTDGCRGEIKRAAELIEAGAHLQPKED